MIQNRYPWRYSEALSFVLLSLFSYSFAADTFYGERIETLEDAFEKSPKKIKRIAKTLNKEIPAAAGWKFKYAVFRGEPGVGKSTLAYALAYKTKYGVCREAATNFITSEGRGAATSSLNGFFSNALELTSPTVIIIDEIDQLLKHYKSKHHDTDASSKALWGFLDELTKQDNLFLIGTTNDITGYPPQMRSRMRAAFVRIFRWDNPAYTGDSIIKQLSIHPLCLTTNAHAYIERHPEEHRHMSVRDIEHFTNIVTDESYEEFDDSSHAKFMLITAKHIKAAFKEMKEIQEELDADSDKDEDYEQRERHHKESLRQQERHHFNTMKYVPNALGVTAFVLGGIGLDNELLKK